VYARLYHFSDRRMHPSVREAHPHDSLASPSIAGHAYLKTDMKISVGNLRIMAYVFLGCGRRWRNSSETVGETSQLLKV
jgi:hypothetical protein